MLTNLTNLTTTQHTQLITFLRSLWGHSPGRRYNALVSPAYSSLLHPAHAAFHSPGAHRSDILSPSETPKMTAGNGGQPSGAAFGLNRQMARQAPFERRARLSRRAPDSSPRSVQGSNGS